ncbi:MAG: DUF4872 domain-containing protein [Chloroflexi bacterium]|nr:DUF4872 domain-containing protein [Chloroflexota bacterium]
MATLIKLPHAVHESTCYVNGLFDILTWKGAKYDYFLLPIVGGMASFAYLKFKLAKPPCMVYWGTSPKYLLQELGDAIGLTQLISEGKSFKNEFPKIKKYLDSNQPVMVGSLDMFYLHYYPDLYRKVHVPIHYILLVGYDDARRVVLVHDCSVPGVQEVPYDDFEQSLNVNVPGMSKKNTYRVFQTPDKFISELELAELGFARKAKRMLHPPVNLLGIPAMRKLAKDIADWTDKECYRYMVAYAGLTPPLISEDLSHNDGLRFEQARVLTELSSKYNRKLWSDAAGLFTASGKLIINLCSAALNSDGKACSGILADIASIEEKAYQMLLPV